MKEMRMRKICGKKPSWHNFGPYPGIYLEELRKTRKFPFSIVYL
jgi:hypothetical protein